MFKIDLKFVRNMYGIKIYSRHGKSYFRYIYMLHIFEFLRAACKEERLRYKVGVHTLWIARIKKAASADLRKSTGLTAASSILLGSVGLSSCHGSVQLIATIVDVY